MENEVLALLKQMYEVKKERRARLDKLGLTKQREGLIAELEAADETIASVSEADDAELRELEDTVKGLGLRLEETVESRYGKVSYTNGYYRFTYAAKPLNVLVDANPDLKWLLKHRKETMVQPRVKVDVFDVAAE